MGLVVVLVLEVVTFVWLCVIVSSFATGAAGGVVGKGEWTARGGAGIGGVRVEGPCCWLRGV